MFIDGEYWSVAMIMFVGLHHRVVHAWGICTHIEESYLAIGIDAQIILHIENAWFCSHIWKSVYTHFTCIQNLCNWHLCIIEYCLNMYKARCMCSANGRLLEQPNIWFYLSSALASGTWLVSILEADKKNLSSQTIFLSIFYLTRTHTCYVTSIYWWQMGVCSRYTHWGFDS